MPTNLTRRAILRGTPAAIAAAATISLPAIASTADADEAADLWRAYRANQVKLYAIIRREWAIIDGGTDPMLLPPVFERDQRIDDADGALVRAIEDLQSNAPAAIAAKLNVAFDHAGST